MKTISPRWATLKQAADYSGLSERHLYNAIADGLIRSSLVKRPNASRGRRLVDLRSLDAWIEKGLMQVGPPPSNPNPEPRTNG
ncbi:helix-turn-helix domain-containing protein [Akkermansiaceae bacterium]|nr:helix-turn-helix domain-containing protein [Akkermansiaceae bacterium]MDB4813291.1 helix-turn-helix domain-containing protein [Akkermansiaceae bacterium]